MKKGFTLIELLIVIAILGVLAAGVVAAINPLERINQANDSNAMGVIGTMANATEAYAVTNKGSYPVAADAATLQTTLMTNGDLKTAVSVPAGYTLTGSSTAIGPAKISISIKSTKYTATPFYAWCSSSGKTGYVALATTCP